MGLEYHGGETGGWGTKGKLDSILGAPGRVLLLGQVPSPTVLWHQQQTRPNCWASPKARPSSWLRHEEAVLTHQHLPRGTLASKQGGKEAERWTVGESRVGGGYTFSSLGVGAF